VDGPWFANLTRRQVGAFRDAAYRVARFERFKRRIAETKKPEMKAAQRPLIHSGCPARSPASGLG
jgi:hypothetical protein